ncbi:unnamed protein product [Ectocarpus sp. 4 AP-2014]
MCWWGRFVPICRASRQQSHAGSGTNTLKEQGRGEKGLDYAAVACARLIENFSTSSCPREMAGDAGRIRKELAECARDTDSGVTAVPKGDSLASLEGTILGPVGTPFEGGTFLINIDIPSGYPFEPPKMKFVTKIWHPNISSQTGAICLDILKDQWSPALTIKTALLSLQALMCSPEPDDPQVGC